MPAEIRMPQLSDTMHAGKILAWRKKEGDRVVRGDILAEVETDKANLEIEAFLEGTLLKVLTPSGSEAKVGDIIAYIGNPGEEIPKGGAKSAEQHPTPPPVQETKESHTDRDTSQTEFRIVRSESDGSPERIKASPLARKIASEKNIDLRAIRGSGPSGRITRKDVETASPTRTREAQHRETSPIAQSESRGSQGQFSNLSKMRETIARQMQESVREAPHFYVTVSVNMREVVKLREILKHKSDYKGLSINHLVMKAAAYALVHEPRVNCAMKNGQVYEPTQINIGIITALDDGLLVPVVREVDQLSLKDLVFEARSAVERARAGRPTSADLSGGTFSISNMGMFDIENFTAIIHPGQGAVLAVSSVREEPVVESRQVVVGLRMKATLSVDHRIIDGVMAGNFLKFFKEALETPALLVM